MPRATWSKRSIESIDTLGSLAYNDILTGSVAANVLTGFDGDDVLYALSGNASSTVAAATILWKAASGRTR